MKICEIIYNEDGTPLKKVFYLRGDGVTISKEFYYLGRNFDKQQRRDNKLHRTDGPAMIYYWDYSTQPRAEHYNIYGRYHRIGGPARIIYQPNGEIHSKDYFIDNIRYVNKQTHNQIIQEALALPPALRLTDPRQWVRELKEEDL